MTIDEKLQFIADRIKDEKEFSVGSERYLYRFINSELRYVWYKGKESIDDYSQMALNLILSSPLKLKHQWNFTEDEKAILRNLPNEFQWIARDKTRNGLFVYTLKPIKTDRHWAYYTKYTTRDITSLTSFKNLFQSIKWSDDEPCEFRKYL